MPGVVAERFDSRSAADGEQPALTLRYVVSGTCDQDAALTALAAATPEESGDLVRQTWRVEPVGDSSTYWIGTVEYGEPQATSYKTDEDGSFEFDAARAGAIHMYQALEHVADYAPPGKTAPNHKGAINVVRDASGLRVEGLDLALPADALAFAVTRYQSSINLSTLYALTRCMNASEMSVNLEEISGTFAPRELLFCGASGSRRGRGDWAVRYAFRASPSAADMTIGQITGIAKAGMDYLWVEYADEADDEAKALVKVPVAVHVERVWRTGNLSALGIPGS